jgi:RNA polymerase sigma factor (sigma-70 family)
MQLREQDPIPTRYSLLSRLQDLDDADSWKDFFDTYWRLIYSVALKSGLTEPEAQDAVQETVISVAKSLHKFQRDRKLGSFKGWLRNIARWRIADQLKQRSKPHHDRESTAHDDSPGPDITEIPDPAGVALEAIWETEWQTNLLKAALERVKHRVREEHYQMFDLYVLNHWPPGKVAKMLRTNVGQVYLAKHRISSLMKKELKALEERW